MKDKKKLISAAWKTWSVIGSDAYSLCAEVGETLTNEAAIEFILDADRIMTIGGYDPFEDGFTLDEAEQILMKEDFT